MSGTIEVPENWICNKESHDFYTYLAHRMDGWMDGWLAFSPHLFMWQLVIRLWGPISWRESMLWEDKGSNVISKRWTSRVKLFLIASIIHAWLSPLSIAFKPHAGAGRRDTSWRSELLLWHSFPFLYTSGTQTLIRDSKIKNTDMGLDTGILFLCQMGHTVKNWQIK